MNLSDDLDYTAQALLDAGDEAGATMLWDVRRDFLIGYVSTPHARIALGAAKNRLTHQPIEQEHNEMKENNDG